MNRIAVLLLTILIIACNSKTEEHSIEGFWLGDAKINNQTSAIAINIARDSIDYQIDLIVPDYDWKFSFPGSKVQNDSIIIGGWKLIYDKSNGVISGVLPAALVPKYDIKFELKKSDKIEVGESVRLASTRQPDFEIDIKEPLWSSLNADDNYIYVGSTDSTFYCINPATKSLRWAKKLDGQIRGKAAWFKENLIIYSDVGTLYALDKDGKKLWSVELEVDSVERRRGNYDYYSSTPMIALDRIYFGNGSGNFYCIDANSGEVFWSFKTDGAIRTNAAILDEQVVFGSFDGNVYSLHLNGELNWKYDVGWPIVGGITVANDLLILGSRSYDLIALDKRGKQQWSYYYWYSWVESTPIFDNGILYVGSSDSQKINAINVLDGQLEWEFDTGGSTWPSPLVTNKYIYATAVGNDSYFHKHFSYLLCLDKRTGEEIWRHSIEDLENKYYGYSGTPIVVNDVLWAATTSGKIYGFKIN